MQLSQESVHRYCVRVTRVSANILANEGMLCYRIGSAHAKLTANTSTAVFTLSLKRLDVIGCPIV